MPNRAVSDDQAGKYVLVVNKDDVVEQKRVKTGQLLVGDLRVIDKRPRCRRPRRADDQRPRCAGQQGGAKADDPSGSALTSDGRDRIMISKFFIERPVLANVLAIVIVLIGVVSLFTLPVSQYPNIVPPTVQVTTNYPGASRPIRWSTTWRCRSSCRSTASRT